MDDVQRLIDALVSCAADSERLEQMANALYYDADALKLDIAALIEQIKI